MIDEMLEMPLFRGCDRTAAAGVLERFPGRLSSYRKGEFLAMQRDACRSLFLLYEGSVYALMTSEQGRELTFDPLSAPDVLASPFLFSTEALYPVSIVAHADCRAWVISRECVRELLERDTAILHNFLNILSDHSIYLSGRLKQFALQTLASRIQNYLAENGTVRNLQETAFILGVTRPSLSRAVAQLVRQGIVRKTAAGYELADRA